MKQYVVVPDGLNKNSDAPSFVFKVVLDKLIKIVKKEDEIYLAPANSFNRNVTEQKAAADYLFSQGARNVFICPSVPGEYIDTRGNAKYLKIWLKNSGLWPLPNTILVSYALHLPRAKLLFSQEGYEVRSSVGVRLPKKVVKDEIVSRLWYYRFPAIHRVYEVLAFPLYFLKIR